MPDYIGGDDLNLFAGAKFKQEVNHIFVREGGGGDYMFYNESSATGWPVSLEGNRVYPTRSVWNIKTDVEGIVDAGNISVIF